MTIQSDCLLLEPFLLQVCVLQEETEAPDVLLRA